MCFCVSVSSVYLNVCFLLAQVLGELPEHCVFTLVYGLPTYWLAGLNEAPDRFLLNFALVWLMVYCSRAMALFVAAALPTLQTSAFMGNAFFTIFYLTGGFVISLENMWLGEEMDSLSVVKRCVRSLKNMCEGREQLGHYVTLIRVHVFDSPVASWFSHVSFMRWGFEGMLQVQFRGNKYPITISNFTINVDGIHVSYMVVNQIVQHFSE